MSTCVTPHASEYQGAAFFTNFEEVWTSFGFDALDEETIK